MCNDLCASKTEPLAATKRVTEQEREKERLSRDRERPSLYVPPESAIRNSPGVAILRLMFCVVLIDRLRTDHHRILPLRERQTQGKSGPLSGGGERRSGGWRERRSGGGRLAGHWR